MGRSRDLASLLGVSLAAILVLYVLCYGTGWLAGQERHAVPSAVAGAVGLFCAMLAAYLGTLVDPAGDTPGDAPGPTGLFVFANAVSSLTLVLSETMSSLIERALSDTIKKAVLYKYMEGLGAQAWVGPILALLILSSIAMCYHASRRVRHGTETRFLVRFVSFFLLLSNAIVTSKTGEADSPELGTAADVLSVLVIVCVASVALTVLTSCAAALPLVGGLVRHPGFRILPFALMAIASAAVGLFLLVIPYALLEALDGGIPGTAPIGRRGFGEGGPVAAFLDGAQTVGRVVLLVVYGTYLVDAGLRLAARVFRGRRHHARGAVPTVALALAFVLAGYLLVAHRPAPSWRGAIEPASVRLAPPKPFGHLPPPSLVWHAVDMECRHAAGWKYESIEDVAFPLDACRPALPALVPAPFPVVLGIVHSSRGATAWKERERAYRRAGAIGRWIGHYFGGSASSRIVFVLDLGMRRAPLGNADRSAQDDRREREIVVRAAAAETAGPVTASHAVEAIGSLVAREVAVGGFSDCALYGVEADGRLVPIRSWSCGEPAIPR